MKSLGDLADEIVAAKPLTDHTPPHMRAPKSAFKELEEHAEKVTAAVMAVAKALPVFVKDTKGQAGGGTYKYFTLDQIMHKLRPVLLAEGFVLSHTTEYDGPGCYSFVTQLWYGGEVVREARCPFTPHPDPQKLGSQVTYYRRYTVCMMFGIVADKDDDGAAAMEPAVNPACAIDELSMVEKVSDLSAELQVQLRKEICEIGVQHDVSQAQVGAEIRRIGLPDRSMLHELTSGEVSIMILKIEANRS